MTSTMRHYHLAYQHSMAALSALSSKTTVADADDAANALVDMKTNALVQTAFTDVGEVVAKTCSMMDENYIQNIQIGFAQPDNIIIETDDKTGIDAFDANDEMIRWNLESPPPPGRTPNQSPARPPTRLAVPQDAAHLNSLHQMVRQDLLELFVAPPNDDEDCAYYGGRVGLRCVHCSTIRRNKAARSAFFPNRLRTIYRDVSSWQQKHFKTCPYVPKSVRNEYEHIKQSDSSRGKKRHWEASARLIGLVDDPHRNEGVVFETGRFGR